jgi:hypothetical protein
LQEQVVRLSPERDLVIEIEGWNRLESGMLYFTLEALEPGSLTEGYFSTITVPDRDVKLGVVITHFNRKQWVLPAIARIRDELLNDPHYHGRIELIVVDNSMNITDEEAEGITLIPNKNLGGSGGFTRGLLHLKDCGAFTHCLFMDDDASCEIESIRRTHNILSYGLSQGFSIAGSLLREIEPYRLFEKGAKFNGRGVQPLKSGMDMRHVHDLLHAEYDDIKPDYGAWWFFAFPIKQVSNFAFPFFVRGDDIRFGLTNSFDIFTMNGIGCWGDDFSLKCGPMTSYLDTRSHLVQAVFDGVDLKSILSMLFKFMAAHLYSYNYGSAASVIKAIRDFSEGPDFFKRNIDTSAIRQDIALFSSDEKMMPISRIDKKLDFPTLNEGLPRKIVRHLTLNGHLIPSIFKKNRLILQPKGFRATFRSVFMYKKIMYEYEPSGLGYIATQNNRKFFYLGFMFVLSIVKLIILFSPIKNKYSGQKSQMMSEEFWREIYSGIGSKK